MPKKPYNMSDDPEEMATSILIAARHKLNQRKRRREKREAKSMIAQAIELGPLAPEDVKKRLSLSAEDLDALGRIASGKPMRNATSVLAALKIKAEYTLEKPKSSEAEKADITVTVTTLPPAALPAPPEAPPPDPLAEAGSAAPLTPASESGSYTTPDDED